MSTHSGATETTCETAGRSDPDSLKDTIASQQCRFEQLLASQALQSKMLLEAHKESIKAAAIETATRTAELGITLPENLVQPTFNWSAKGKDDAQSLRNNLRSPRRKEVDHHDKDNRRSHDKKKEDLSGDCRSSDYHQFGADAKSRNVDSKGSDHHNDRTRSRVTRSLHHRGNRSRSPDRHAHHRTRGNRSRSPDRRSHDRTRGDRSRSPGRHSHHKTRGNRSRSPVQHLHHRTRGNRSRSPDRHLHQRTRSWEREDRRKEQCRSSPGSPAASPITTLTSARGTNLMS